MTKAELAINPAAAHQAAMAGTDGVTMIIAIAIGIIILFILVSANKRAIELEAIKVAKREADAAIKVSESAVKKIESATRLARSERRNELLEQQLKTIKDEVQALRPPKTV